jgi:hypothetical protein
MHLFIQILLILAIAFFLIKAIYIVLKSKKQVDTISFDKKEAKSIIDNSHISTVNTFLEAEERNAIVYEVFSLYFDSYKEMKEDQSSKYKDSFIEFKIGTNEERLFKAQKCYKIDCENIVFRKGIFGTEHPKWFKILLVEVRNINGIEQREVLKKVDSTSIDHNY